MERRIIRRRYKLLADFSLVHSFLTDIVGIDLTRAMLDKLGQKYPGRNIELVCGNFFDICFGENKFDTAVPFQAMHHFSHSEKVKLYKKIYKALKSEGIYIECDYMVTEQSVEDELFAEYERLKCELEIPDGGFYHFDIPCTIDNQIMLLKKAGFTSAEMVWRMGNTTIIVAKNKVLTLSLWRSR